MIVDAHVYCLPPRMRDSTGFSPPANEQAIGKAIYRHPEGPRALVLSSPESILQSMDKNEIEKSLLVAFPWNSSELCLETNEYLLDLVSKNNRFSCLCSVQPKQDGFIEKAEYWLACDASGLKVNPVWQNFEIDGPEMDDLSIWAAAKDIPIMVHIDQAYKNSPASPGSFFSLVQRHPKTKYLASHLGGLLGLYSLHPPVENALNNVWFDTAVSSTMQFVSFYVQAGLAGRLVFGTDFPFNHSHSQRQPLDDLKALSLDDKVKEPILATNYFSLFKTCP